VICEIVREDGQMARMPDLLEFSEKHGINIVTIADLIAHRRRWEKLVELKARPSCPPSTGFGLSAATRTWSAG